MTILGCGEQSDAESAAIATVRNSLGDLTLYEKEFIESDSHGRYLFVLTGKSDNVGNGKAKVKYAVIVWNVKNKFLGDLTWRKNPSLPYIVLEPNKNQNEMLAKYKKYVGWGTNIGL